ncbi:MAG: OsmC family protein [Candidatus Dormibacteraeota bacterium]|nr:OsmC family protein [Candidatus Dormibacteraeota bacterium]
MAQKHSHHYEVRLRWTGNRGTGTSAYAAYGRDHMVSAAGKPDLSGSSDTAFRGDPDRWNPEELLVAALSQCHLLAYLHECVKAGVSVTEYSDAASGTMETDAEGGGHFTEVTLLPVVSVAEPGMAQRAEALHDEAHRHCFIASSVNFPVTHRPSVKVAGTL